MDILAQVATEETTSIRMRLDYRPVMKPVRDMPDHLKVDDYVLWEWIQEGGENIMSKGQARVFRQKAYQITARMFGGSPWGWIRKGKTSLAWFPWPGAGQATIRVEACDGNHFRVRLGHPIGFVRKEHWEVAPVWVDGHEANGPWAEQEPKQQDVQAMLDEECSEFNEDSDLEKEHDLDYKIIANLTKVQDDKAKERQEMAVAIFLDQDLKEMWAHGTMEFLSRRTLLDLPMENPLAGIVLDVRSLVYTYRKKITLKRAVNLLGQGIGPQAPPMPNSPATTEEVRVFRELILDAWKQWKDP